MGNLRLYALCILAAACGELRVQEGVLCDADKRCPGSLGCDALGVCRAAVTVCGTPNTHETLQAAADDTTCETLVLLAARYDETLTVSRPLTIDGTMSTLATLQVQPGGDVTADTVTIDTAVENHGRLALFTASVTAPIISSGELRLTSSRAEDVSVSDGIVTINDSSLTGLEVLGGELTLHATSIVGGEDTGVRIDTPSGTTASLRLENVTIAENQHAGLSAAGMTVTTGGTLTLDFRNVTLSANQSGDGAATSGLSITVGPGGSLQGSISNSVLAGNQPGKDCAATGAVWMNGGFNLLNTLDSACFDLDRPVALAPPQLDEPAPNGGVGLTMAPRALSPVIDAGDPAGCADLDGGVLAQDATGAPRTGRCDIGAVEFLP